LQWTRRFGVSGVEKVTSMVTDGHGSVYVAGYSWGDLSGGGESVSEEAYLRKYDADGVLQWTQEIGFDEYDVTADAVATDSSGHVYVAGSKSNDGLDGGGHTGVLGAYARKYSSDGIEQWTEEFGSSGFDYVTAAAADSSGNLYISGYTAEESPDETFAHVRKYDADGDEQWVEQFGFGPTGHLYAYSVAIDGSGSVYVAGESRGDPERDNLVGTIVYLYDAYVRKYNTDGVEQWTERFGTHEDDVVHSVTVDRRGNIYVAGSTYGDLDGGGNPDSVDAFVTLIVR
jgi:hypothetical protein